MRSNEAGTEDAYCTCDEINDRNVGSELGEVNDYHQFDFSSQHKTGLVGTDSGNVRCNDCGQTGVVTATEKTSEAQLLANSEFKLEGNK